VEIQASRDPGMPGGSSLPARGTAAGGFGIESEPHPAPARGVRRDRKGSAEERR
jgi:hypothetical protein